MTARATTSDALLSRRVKISSKGVSGTLVSLSGGRAIIETRIGTISVAEHEIEKEQRAEVKNRPAVTLVRKSTPAAEKTLNLHKKLVEEVEPLLGAFLDAAIIEGLNRVVVVHGKGTGRVKNEVWRCLKRHPQVERFLFADVTEGSYGATVVYFK